MATPTAATGTSGLSRLFNDRKINAKIAIGFACVLAITAVISIVSNLAFNSVSAGFETYNRYVAVVGNRPRHRPRVPSVRRFVREYAVSGDEAMVTAAEKEFATLKATVAKGLVTIKHPERLAKMQETARQIDVYARDFAKLVPLRRAQMKDTKEVLDPSGQKLRLDFEALQAAAAKAGNSNTLTLAGEGMKYVMMARLNVNKLLGRHDEAAAKAAESAFAELKTVMTGLDGLTKGSDTRKAYDEIKLLVDKYHAAFTKAAHDAHEIDVLLNGEMKKNGEDTAADSESIKKSGIADEQQIEHETASQVSWAERFVLILAIGGLMVGVVLAWLIGRGISRPVVGMYNSMRALAGGDTSVTVPGIGRKDEVGQIAEAVRSMADKVSSTIHEVKTSAREVTNASAEISTSTTDLSQRTEEQAASLEETSASMEEMSATVKKNAENAQQASELAVEYPRGRRSRRRGGGQGGRGDGEDRRVLAQDLRHHQRDRRDRAADQSAGAQRGGGSGARRRCRPRLRGGRLRSAQPGAALLAGGQGHQGPDHQQHRPGEGRRRTGQPRGHCAQRDRRIDQEGRRHRVGHRQRQHGAVDWHRADQQGAGADGRGDAAELGAGRGERSDCQDAGASGPRQWTNKSHTSVSPRVRRRHRPRHTSYAASPPKADAPAPRDAHPIPRPKRNARCTQSEWRGQTRPGRTYAGALATAVNSDTDWKEF